MHFWICQLTDLLCGIKPFVHTSQYYKVIFLWTLPVKEIWRSSIVFTDSFHLVRPPLKMAQSQPTWSLWQALVDSDLLTLCAVGRSGGVEEVNLSGGRLLSDTALSHLEQNGDCEIHKNCGMYISVCWARYVGFCCTFVLEQAAWCFFRWNFVMGKIALILWITGCRYAIECQPC